MDLREMPCLTPILLRWNLYTRRDSDLFAPLSAGLVSDYSPYFHANSLFKTILQGCRVLPISFASLILENGVYYNRKLIMGVHCRPIGIIQF
jgi:hypothetical protein